MNYFNLIFAVLFMHNLSAQYKESENSVTFNYDINFKVELDTSISVNKEHVYSDYLSKQDDDYIQWVYQLNEQRNKSIKKNESQSVLINDKAEANSLIFTLIEEGVTRYDTLSNQVVINTENKPEKIGFFRKLWTKITMPNVKNVIKEQNIQGSLPEGCMSWVNANSRRLKCGIEVIQASSEVTMVLLNVKGDVVHTFADETLYRGWNNYRWNRVDHEKGNYTLSITIDGECMTQNVKIK